MYTETRVKMAVAYSTRDPGLEFILVSSQSAYSWTYSVLSRSPSIEGKEPNMFHNYKTEKITCKASDVAENLQLYRVVQFFRLRSLCTTTHLILYSEHLPIYASCMTISGGRTELNNTL